jgi:hypothetical protein
MVIAAQTMDWIIPAQAILQDVMLDSSKWIRDIIGKWSR